MDIISTAKYLRTSPRKLRPIAASLIHLPVIQAEKHLRVLPKKGAKLILKVLQTAVADAQNNFQKKKDTLIIRAIHVDDGIRMKRFRAIARGSAHAYDRLTTHIKVILRTKED